MFYSTTSQETNQIARRNYPVPFLLNNGALIYNGSVASLDVLYLFISFSIYSSKVLFCSYLISDIYFAHPVSITINYGSIRNDFPHNTSGG
jgi:hypothetical protein